MQKKLEQMFPSGQWSTGQKSWMVRHGTYFCAVADVVDGAVVLTELGKQLSPKAVVEPAKAPKEEVQANTAIKKKLT